MFRPSARDAAGDHSVNHLEVSRPGRHALGSPDRPTPHLPFTIDFYNFMETCTCCEECAGQRQFEVSHPSGPSVVTEAASPVAVPSGGSCEGSGQVRWTGERNVTRLWGRLKVGREEERKSGQGFGPPAW